MSTLRDEDLTRLLAEAASSYDVPPHGPAEVLAAHAKAPLPVPVVRRRWVQLSAAAAVITAGAVLGASLYGGSEPIGTKTATAPEAAGTAKSGRPGATPPRTYGLTNLSGNGTVDAGAPSRSAGTGAASGGAVGSSAGVAGGVGLAPAPAYAAVPGLPPAAAPAPVRVGVPADGAASRVVKTGRLALVVKKDRVSSTLKAVEKAARGQGGYLASGTTNEYGDNPSGELTIRVPADKFEDLVAQVRGLDAKVRTATTTGKDVTAQYSDLATQLRTLKATRDRFYTILTKANTIGEILAVQQRIDDVSGQIDRIEGQRKLLASQSDLATLTVSVSEEGDPVVKAAAKPRSGISQAFVNAKDGFVTGVEAIISHSGRALLWLLSIGLVLLIARSAFRVARRRMV